MADALDGWEVFGRGGTMTEFCRTTITFAVLSEEPIPEAMELDTILAECDEGAYVADWNGTMAVEKLTGRDMAEALKAAGSDPSFFQLNDDGEKVDEDE